MKVFIFSLSVSKCYRLDFDSNKFVKFFKFIFKGEMKYVIVRQSRSAISTF